MTYIRWERLTTYSGWRSTCGRYVISSHSTKSGYLGLLDATTNTEYVCRTENSAKTLARNLYKLLVR